MDFQHPRELVGVDTDLWGARLAYAAAVRAERRARVDEVLATASTDLERVLAQGAADEAAGVLQRAGEGIRKVLDETEPAPQLTPVVFLRGAGVDGDSWKAIRSALGEQGWVTVTDRTQAWHLARGGTPVVVVVFQAGKEHLTVMRVRAKYAEGTKHASARSDTVLDGVAGGRSPYTLDPAAIVQLVTEGLEA